MRWRTKQEARRPGLRVALVAVGAWWLSLGCGGTVEGSCPDVSGEWRMTVRCSELSVPVEETWSQSGCDVTRHRPDGRTAATLDSHGWLSTSNGVGGTCRGKVGAEQIEISCPFDDKDQCGFPSACCIKRWER